MNTSEMNGQWRGKRGSVEENKHHKKKRGMGFREVMKERDEEGKNRHRNIMIRNR